MEFTKLEEGHECSCLDGCAEDTINYYARKTNESGADSAPNNFKKINRLPIDPDDCNEICGLKGLSIDLWNEESKLYVMNKYCTTFKIAPAVSRKKMSIIRLKPDTGMVKFTPHQRGGYDAYHYDLYPQDNFDSRSHVEFFDSKTVDALERELIAAKYPGYV